MTSPLKRSTIIGGHLRSGVRKRSVVVGKRKTSVTLEDAFWDALKDIAHERNVSLFGLIADVDSKREGPNLSSELRTFVLEHYRNRYHEALQTG